MKRWRWLSAPLVHVLHDRQIAEHGGLDGVRDAGAIESALARPLNIAAYEKPDAARLAAAYCHGMVKDHGFADGNKRVGWLLARLFLADNGFDLAFDKLDAIRLVEGVAAGTIGEAELAEWFRQRSRKK